MISKLIVTRIFYALVTLLLVSAVIFAAVEILPGDVASRILGRSATEESLAELRRQLGYDQPALVRYFEWLGGVVQGDFGNSISSQRPVSEIIGPKLLNTAILATCAFLLSLPMSLIPAALQAVKPGSLVDTIISSVNFVLLSIPDYLLASIALITFVVAFPILPSTSMVTENSSFGDWVVALLMPTVVLAISVSIYTVRLLRDGLIEVLSQDYVRMAELKGMPQRIVLWRHAFPNALGPSINNMALNISYLIGGVIIVEEVFTYPGFGSVMVNALTTRDAPVVEATVLIAAAIYICANTLADIGSILSNPRLRGKH
ncbi:ABC transporter permease [Roseovarius pelagicus]|uniref:ABC transporter permease n=1 Tax=Roseovarius pelagicus TaxID=2980108 RepID=A0ABY6D5V6_9RHOB|nr:ABC transporter permease [Roseovarius pelagicus]UXX81537.1 ABC transporter permease [Roseovarius pelagicus]